MYTFLLVTTAIVALASLLPLSAKEHWLVRSMDFPRLQLALITFVLLAAQCFLVDLASVKGAALPAVTLLLLGYQLWWILPYSRFRRVEVASTTQPDPDNTVSMITANVLTSNRQADTFLALVRQRQPDMILTLESDHWWETALTPLEQDYPHSVKHALDNLYGMHLYSRYPLKDPEVKFLVEEGVPSIHTLFVLPSGVEVRAHFVHPAPPSPTENETSGERDAELILLAKSIEKTAAPTIVAGDLNDVAWSATTRLFRRISGLLDPRIGRGLLNTFHADYWFMRWPLDHVFHSESFTLTEIARLEKFGSDHFAIYTELCYQPAAETDQEPLQARPKDQAWADDKLENTDTSVQEVPAPKPGSP